MRTFRILVFQDIPLVGRFYVFKPTIQRNKNAVETSNFAFVTFVIYRDLTTEESLYLYVFLCISIHSKQY